MANKLDITDGQIRSLKTGISKNEKEVVWIVSQLIGRKINALSKLTRGDWFQLRDQMYPKWKNDDWSVGDSFRIKKQELIELYREQELGQLKLF